MLQGGKKLAQEYDNAFINYEGIIIPKIKKNYGHSYHIYPLKINFKKFKIQRKFFKKLKKQKKINYSSLYPNTLTTFLQEEV